MANNEPIQCLILACGNPLRSDDGVGPRLAAWADEHFRDVAGVRIIARQQWTPELAEDLAQAASVLFVDAATDPDPGAIELVKAEPNEQSAEPNEQSLGLPTHHLDAGQLLGLCRELYAVLPRKRLLLTIGLGSTELGGSFSEAVEAAMPHAQALLANTVAQLMEADGAQP